MNGDRNRSLSRAFYVGHEHQYVLIGGAACELIMGEVGLDFRATKDLDIVLIVEALDAAFAERFWAFVEAGGIRDQAAKPGQEDPLPLPEAEGRGVSGHA